MYIPHSRRWAFVSVVVALVCFYFGHGASVTESVPALLGFLFLIVAGFLFFRKRPAKEALSPVAKRNYARLLYFMIGLTLSLFGVLIAGYVIWQKEKRDKKGKTTALIAGFCLFILIILLVIYS